MKLSFYPKLAWEGIRKNKRLYLPYILTCIGIITMLYIIQFLVEMPSLQEMPGGHVTTEMLQLGVFIVGLFSAMLLVYTNSFLMRRRKKEFGLYHILGMGKRNLSILLLWESVLLYVITTIGGILGGVLLAKLGELSLITVLGGEVDFDLRISINSLAMTLTIFTVIFFYIFLKSLLQFRKLNAVALLQSETVGEKPPKANYLLGIAGFVILAVAYYIALTIENPVLAIGWFFVAVSLVIIATYLLFIAGSVVLCKILQKNKRYYYQKNHFVSVSSMAYRMKRNGAGLASISILSTMVLVMMMGSGSLYFGKEDSINATFPHDISASIGFLTKGDEARFSKEKESSFFEEIDGILEQYEVSPKNVEQVLHTSITGMIEDGMLRVNRQMVDEADTQDMGNVVEIQLLSLHSYNRMADEEQILQDNEVMIHTVGITVDEPTVTLHDGTVWNVKKTLDSTFSGSSTRNSVLPLIYIVTPNMDDAVNRFNNDLGKGEEDSFIHLNVSYNFDTNLSAEKQLELGMAIRERMRDLSIAEEGNFYSYHTSIKEEERAEFYGLYGGLFFLGIFLSILFLAATVLIIYYKQVSEGYEDESRFEIMRKVGMTTEDIRKSINSQVLTVFFLPLLASVLHVAFAFPLVQKLLSIFNLQNTLLSVVVTGVAIIIFTIFYAAIYRVTSNAYYNIVSENKK